MSKFFRHVITTVAVFITVFPCFAGGPLPIRVLVYGEQRGEHIVYHYTIINNGTQPFNSIVIGSRYDSAKDDTFPELGKLPIGWRYGTQGETGVEIILDPASTTQPTGWFARAMGQQDTALYYLRWEIPIGSKAAGVQPGQTLSGFSITVPRERDTNLIRMPAGSDMRYLTGHFTVGLPLGPDVHGEIEQRKANTTK